MFNFEIIDNNLICTYEPDGSMTVIEEILKKIQTSTYHLKRVFNISKENIPDFCEFNQELHFVLGNVENGYVKINKDILNTKHYIYFDKNIEIEEKYFIASRNISICKKIIDLFKSDVYIECDIDDDNVEYGHIDIKTFNKLIKLFPNSTEQHKYVDARISTILDDYLAQPQQYQQKLSQYIQKKQQLSTQPTPQLNTKIQLDIITDSLNILQDMLDNYTVYHELDWQRKIKDILCVIFPKYMYTLREVDFGKQASNKRRPDYTLIDSNGYIDVMEIKKPDDKQIMRKSPERNNSVPIKLFQDTIIQASKYTDVANKNCNNVKNNIIKKLNKDYPKNGLTIDDIHINNPQAIVLLGRSNNLSKTQRYDYEMIKRQYKDLAEFMTYDELLTRLQNLKTALEQKNNLTN